MRICAESEFSCASELRTAQNESHRRPPNDNSPQELFEGQQSIDTFPQLAHSAQKTQEKHNQLMKRLYSLLNEAAIHQIDEAASSQISTAPA